MCLKKKAGAGLLAVGTCSNPGRTLTGGYRAEELCESRGGRPGLPSLISLRFLWT